MHSPRAVWPRGAQINTEWADYTSPELPWIEEDRTLDAASRYPGEHAFEKMTAGLYMGELARLILLRRAPCIIAPHPLPRLAWV